MRVVQMLCVMAVALTIHTVHAVEPVTMLRVSTPFLISGGAALRFDGEEGGLDPVLHIEAGIGGGKVSIGLDGTGDKAFGYGIKASYLHTWFEPIEVDEDQSFLGIEGEISIQSFILNLGGFRRVSDGDDDWLVHAGLGLLL